ncbi:hypothetical protein EIP91_010892 [Steccherinum ochraceum]|uniref:Uncharacterized protein n=1 Tax=Steccherinum ochraceum TaxID=92696 RepID=A0A4R0RMW9_9APHY|nr:hypothetical protein EIP91_010892 [Steccherinum ochraceum]
MRFITTTVLTAFAATAVLSASLDDSSRYEGTEIFRRSTGVIDPLYARGLYDGLQARNDEPLEQRSSHFMIHRRERPPKPREEQAVDEALRRLREEAPRQATQQTMRPVAGGRVNVVTIGTGQRAGGGGGQTNNAGGGQTDGGPGGRTGV